MVNVLFNNDPTALEYEVHRLSKELINVKHLYFNNNHGELIDEIGQTDLFASDITYVIHNAVFMLGTNTTDKDLANKIAKVDASIYVFLEAKKADDIFRTEIKANIKSITKFTSSACRQLINRLLNNANVQFQNSYVQDKFESLLSLDPFLVENETNKLILSSENGIITDATVKSIVADSTESNLFKMMAYLLNNNKKELIALYDDLILAKHQPVELIQVLSSQLFNLKLYKFATSYSADDIESILGMSRFVQSNNRSLSSNISIEQLDRLINDLFLLDYNIKHNLVDPYQGLKLLIAK